MKTPCSVTFLNLLVCAEGGGGVIKQETHIVTKKVSSNIKQKKLPKFYQNKPPTQFKRYLQGHFNPQIKHMFSYWIH